MYTVEYTNLKNTQASLLNPKNVHSPSPFNTCKRKCWDMDNNNANRNQIKWHSNFQHLNPTRVVSKALHSFWIHRMSLYLWREGSKKVTLPLSCLISLWWRHSLDTSSSKYKFFSIKIIDYSNFASENT